MQPAGPIRVVAIFGPTAAGKTGVAIELAELLRERGEEPAAVSADAIQVYRGLEVLSGAADEEERARLEHRLIGMVDPAEEFSAGRFQALAHAEIDGLAGSGRRPIVVGGTGLYLRAALSDLDLRPPVDSRLRRAVEEELELRGPEALHRELDPEIASGVHPNDRKRVARLTELSRAGIAPARSSDRIWSEELRRPTLLAGITLDRDELDARIDARVERMIASGAKEEVQSAHAAGTSRTARAAIGFEQLLAGDVDAMKAAQRRYARRQLTWMRKLGGLEPVDRTGRDDRDVAGEIAERLARCEAWRVD